MGVAVLAVITTGILIFVSSSGKTLSFLKFNSGMSAGDISQKSINYLNKNVLQQGQTATLEGYSEESGVVKFTIKIADKTYDSYATKDGKLLFPEALNIRVQVTQQTNSAETSK